MSVLKRLNTLVRSNLNDLSSRLGGREMVREMKSSVREAKSQQIEARVIERRLSKEYEALLDEAASWEQRAEMALRAGDERLARQAIIRKQEVMRRAQGIKQSLDEQQAYLLDLETSIEAIEVKFQGYHQRRTAMGGPSATGAPRPAGASRYTSTADLEARAELGTLGDSETFDTFNDMAGRIEHRDARYEAMQELEGDLDGSDDVDLEKKFRQLESSRELKRLKKKDSSLDELRRRLDEE